MEKYSEMSVLVYQKVMNGYDQIVTELENSKHISLWIISGNSMDTKREYRRQKVSHRHGVLQNEMEGKA